ncbi:hypothetical protein, partial [Rhizobium phaseoli]|uniref:hypothetical protein n=1 Tax=Rhizobium phaseoli TaxID=396 RepID=UPI0014366ED4
SGSLDDDFNLPKVRKFLRTEARSTVSARDALVAVGATAAQARDYVNMAVETFLTYFFHEGAVNSASSWDGTFTVGAGLNVTRGAGIW